MTHIDTDIEIHAPAERVWTILTDFAAYPEWNPFVVHADGVLEPGERLSVELRQVGSKPMSFKPRVVAVDRGHGFAWLGRFLVPRLMDGEHSYEIEELAPDRVRFHQRERFRGLLVPFMRRMFDTKTKPSFDAMNQALKARAEAEARGD